MHGVVQPDRVVCRGTGADGGRGALPSGSALSSATLTSADKLYTHIYIYSNMFFFGRVRWEKVDILSTYY